MRHRRGFRPGAVKLVKSAMLRSMATTTAGSVYDDNYEKGPKMRIATAVLLSATMVGQTGIAQTVDSGMSTSLGGARLTLGMSEAEARRRLGEFFVVMDGGFVKAKDGHTPGAVAFEGGRLTKVYKDWDAGIDQEGSADVVQRLIDLVGTSECQASTVKTMEPSARIDWLVIQCGAFRTVEVSVGKSPGMKQPFVNVREVFSR